MPVRFEHGRALVVGVGHDLPVTETDAKAVAERLRDPARCAYPPEQVELLCGSAATRAGILAGLARLAREARADDTVIIYFSGHGAALPYFHLVPYGYDPTNRRRTAISEKELGRRLRAIHAGRLAIFLDCCHAGGQASVKAGPSAPLPPAVLEEFRQGQGRVILASSRANELSHTGNPYSEFTKALLEGLAGSGTSKFDGYARITDVAMWAGRKVPERTGDRQHPVLAIAKADNFALAWYAAGSKTPLPPSDPVVQPGRNGPASVPHQTPSPGPAPFSPPSLTADHDQAHRRLANHRENLGLIEERMAQFVLSTDIPLGLVKERNRLQKEIADLEARLRESLGQPT